jgi:hypothetical protein
MMRTPKGRWFINPTSFSFPATLWILVVSNASHKVIGWQNTGYRLAKNISTISIRSHEFMKNHKSLNLSAQSILDGSRF